MIQLWRDLKFNGFARVSRTSQPFDTVLDVWGHRLDHPPITGDSVAEWAATYGFGWSHEYIPGSKLLWFATPGWNTRPWERPWETLMVFLNDDFHVRRIWHDYASAKALRKLKAAGVDIRLGSGLITRS